jgi:hypothetical protein
MFIDHGSRSGNNKKCLMKRVARLALVDLAGSEAMSRSFASSGGKADPAGIATNLGLSTLSRVMMARAQQCATTNDSSSSHAPYRDSALTFLLRPYLTNAELVLLVCMSGHQDNMSESISTGKFSSVVRGVHTRAGKVEETEEFIQEFGPEVCIFCSRHNFTTHTTFEPTHTNTSNTNVQMYIYIYTGF